jgi:hypothetical protein
MITSNVLETKHGRRTAYRAVYPARVGSWVRVRLAKGKTAQALINGKWSRVRPGVVYELPAEIVENLGNRVERVD